MAMKNGGGGSRFSYPRTASELDKANARSHVPHGPNIPSQTEDGAAELARGHRGVTDLGMMTRGKPAPGSKSTPMNGDPDVPFESFPCIR